MFGSCNSLDHVDENVLYVCLTCFEALCSQCLLTGSHSASDTADHQIISTTEALKLALLTIEEVEIDDTAAGTAADSVPCSAKACDKCVATVPELPVAPRNLSQKWQRRKEKLAELLVNNLAEAERLWRRLDQIANKQYDEIDDMKNRRLQICSAVEQGVLLVLRYIKWAEEFLDHLHLAVPPCTFMYYRRRHELMLEWWSDVIFKTEYSSAIDRFLPEWIFNPLVVKGDIYIGPASVSLTKADVTVAGLLKQPGELLQLQLEPRMASDSPTENRPSTVGASDGSDGSNGSLTADGSFTKKYLAEENAKKTDLLTDTESGRVYAVPWTDRRIIRKPLENDVTYLPDGTSDRSDSENCRPGHSSDEALPEDVKRLWNLLKEYRWEGLTFYLKTTLFKELSSLLARFGTMAAWFDSFQEFVDILFEVETHWLETGTAKELADSSLITTLLSLLARKDYYLDGSGVAWVRRNTLPLLAEIEILENPRRGGANPGQEAGATASGHNRPSDTQQAIDEARMSRITEIEISVKDKVSAFIKNLTKMTSGDIPISLQRLLRYISRKSACTHVANNYLYAKRNLEGLVVNGHIPKTLETDFGAAAAAHFLLQHVLGQNILFENNCLSEAAHDLACLIFDIADAIWTVVMNRFQAMTNQELVPGTPENEYCLTLAHKVYFWIRNVILPHTVRGVLVMQRKFDSAVCKILCEYICTVDCQLMASDDGTGQRSLGDEAVVENPSTTAALAQEVRNYDRIVLAAMTFKRT